MKLYNVFVIFLTRNQILFFQAFHKLMLNLGIVEYTSNTYRKALNYLIIVFIIKAGRENRTLIISLEG